MTLPEKALDIAITQLGVQEDPKKKNSGKVVDQYLAAVGLGPGYSWCMAFVYWCHQQAATAMGVFNPMYKTGGVLLQWNQKKLKYSKTSPMPGDVFIMDFGKGLGHTGIVEKVVGDIIHTVEGNSNDEGSREGHEVCRRTRKISSIKGFLRFS